MDVIVLPEAPSVVLPDTVKADVTVALFVVVLPDTVRFFVIVAFFNALRLLLAVTVFAYSDELFIAN